MKRQASDLLRFVLVLLAGVSLLLGIENALDRNGSQDFQWGPSRVLLQGKNPYTPYIEYRKGFTQVNPYLLTQVPFYPASGYVFLWPYAALDWRAAKVAWALSNVALSFLLLAGLRRVLPSPHRGAPLLLVALLLIGTPYRNTVGNGQHGLLCLAPFVWAMVLSQQRRPWMSGILLAVSWFKYTLSFPLSLFFVARRQFMPVVVAATVHVVLTVFVGAWIREPPWTFVLKTLEVPMLASRADGAMASHPSYLDPFGLASGWGIPMGMVTGLFVAVVIAVVLVISRPANRDDLLLSFLALSSIALSLHRTYDWIVLVFPLSVILSRREAGWLAVLFGLLIVATWYVQRALDLVVARIDGPVMTAVNHSFYLVTVGLLYVALAGAGMELWRSGRGGRGRAGQGRPL